MNSREKDLLDACKKAQKFISKLEKLYTPVPIEPNSNSGLDWDIRHLLEKVINQ